MYSFGMMIFACTSHDLIACNEMYCILRMEGVFIVSLTRLSNYLFLSVELGQFPNQV